MKVYYYLLYYKANQIRGECIRSCRQSPVCASRAPGATARGGRAAAAARRRPHVPASATAPPPPCAALRMDHCQVSFILSVVFFTITCNLKMEMKNANILFDLLE